MRIFENANFEFVKHRRKAYAFSLFITLIGLVSFATKGFDWGIDFTGGKEFVVRTASPVDLGTARGALQGTLGRAPEVKRYGDDLLVRTEAGGTVPELGAKITGAIGNGARIVRSDEIAPRFASDLQKQAIYAVLASVLVIFVYVIVRFQWTWGVGAVVSLVHDVVFTLSVFSLLHGILPFSLSIDQTTIAAFLTIVGYSINDTVVVFDRIREDQAKYKHQPLDEVANRAMNETLSRTMLTAGTTLLSLLVVFIFAGETVRGFAFALLIGIALGTYSSVFIATPVMLDVQRWLAKRRGGPATGVARPTLARG